MAKDMDRKNCKEFCEKHPKNRMSLAWSQMIEDDPEETDYTEDDYSEEYAMQQNLDHLTPRDIMQVEMFFSPDDDE